MSYGILPILCTHEIGLAKDVYQNLITVMKQ